jgi:hypothetical protein
MKSTNQIFRQAALEYKQQRCFGSVIQLRPLSFTLLGALAAAVAVLILSFLLFGHYTKKTAVTGRLVPDQALVGVQPALSGVGPGKEKHWVLSVSPWLRCRLGRTRELNQPPSDLASSTHEALNQPAAGTLEPPFSFTDRV